LWGYLKERVFYRQFNSAAELKGFFLRHLTRNVAVGRRQFLKAVSTVHYKKWRASRRQNSYLPMPHPVPRKFFVPQEKDHTLIPQKNLHF